KTATISIVKKDQLVALPTRGFEQVVGIQNSVVRSKPNAVTRFRGGRESNQQGELNLRGGRRSDVAYYVDGFSQQDPLSGISTANISNNAIQEVSIIAGGFPAEYGNVSAGIVNTITSSGSNEYHGTAEGVSDFVTDDSYDNNWYSADLGGPIPGLDKATFFGSVERRYLGDRAPSSITESVLSNGSKLLPKNSLDGWSWQGKLNFDITPNFKLLLSTNGSQDKWSEYQHNYLFNLAHMPYYDDKNQGYNAKITHTLNAKTFYNLSGSYFVTERFRGDGVLREDLLAYNQPGGNARFNTRTLFWDEGHVWDDYLKRKAAYVGIKGDINTVMGPYHTVKVGVDFQRHTMRYFQHFFPAKIGDPDDPDDVDNYLDINRFGYDSLANEIDDENGRNSVKNPINFAGYIQDRFEWRGMIINAGVRLDYFDYKANRIKNPAKPLDPDTLNDANAFTLELDTDLEDSEKFTRVSPRLGVAFPVSDVTQLRLNYGKFFQRPDLANLYVGDDYFQHKVNLGGYFVSFGNPNLEPEKITQYELGLTHQMGDNTVVDVAAFYKDIVDQIQVINQAASPNSYATFVNQDYGTVKGLEFAFTMQRTNNIYLNAKYTLTYANGTGSFATTQRNVAWQAADAPKQSAALDFDQRHSVVGNIDWRTGPGGGPLMGDMHPLENTGVNVLITAASGLPYAPSKVFNEVTLGATAPSADAPRNSSYGPWTFFIDLKAEKTFNFGDYKVVPFVWVKNLLDRDNVFNVYESTGRANTTNWLASEAGQAFANATPDLDSEKNLTASEEFKLKENNPQNYGNPRQIMFGLRVAF
ncbi:MAG: TonB-dependent receptor plug domain-containing protein, partial [Candidatus Zixiibacteriota bacterium]